MLFAAVDTGNARLGITGYNGGLFAPDPLVDGIALPDHLVARFVELTKYDFTSEISVTILGHLFEQTIGDIEQDLLHVRGQAVPATTKKKRDGIVYTPRFRSPASSSTRRCGAMMRAPSRMEARDRPLDDIDEAPLVELDKQASQERTL